MLKKNIKSKILKLKKIYLKDNFLVIFRDLKLNLSRGEIYFSYFNNLKIKNWKRNNKSTQNFFVVKGEIKFLIFNEINKKRLIFRLKEKDNFVLSIPPRNWYSFKPIVKKSILFNQLNLSKDKSKKYDVKFAKKYTYLNKLWKKNLIDTN